MRNYKAPASAGNFSDTHKRGNCIINTKPSAHWLSQVVQALQDAGAETRIVSPAGKTVKGWDHVDWGEEFDVDTRLEDADPEQYDALLLPGGVMNPDKLRRNKQAQEFVRHFFTAGKPVALMKSVQSGRIKVKEGLSEAETAVLAILRKKA